MSRPRASSQGIYIPHHYRQAVDEFYFWHKVKREQAPQWDGLHTDDFRAYLGFLDETHLSRAAIAHRLGALKSFYQFLIRHGFVVASPVQNLVLAKTPDGHRASMVARDWCGLKYLRAMRYGC